MTQANTNARWQYAGNGVTTAFIYDNKIFVNTDLKVYVDGVLKTLTTDYTVSGVGVAGGGNVTFVVAPASGTNVVIVREVSSKQDSHYKESSTFPAATVEDDLDRQASANQQQAEKIARSLRLADFDTPEEFDSLPVKATRASKFLAFDVDGKPVASAAPAGGAVVSVFGATLIDDADGPTAIATLGKASQAEAEAGSLDTKIMTPLRVAQAIDAQALQPGVSSTLTKGFNAVEHNLGTVSSGTTTLDPANGNFQKLVNGGAFTLAMPASTCSIVLQITNNTSAGAITVSGATEQTGESLTTTNGDDFLLFITRVNGFVTLHIRALQ